MSCINLLETFGDQYRITYDEAYNSSNIPHAKRDPWMMQIPCKGPGITIYPHGGNVLAIQVDRRPSIAAQLKATKGVTLYQDGNGELTFLFEVSLFPQVATIVRPRRPRKVTETQRQTLAKYAFRCRDGAHISSAG